jgi:hypothetical protein
LPPLRKLDEDHSVACHHADRLTLRGALDLRSGVSEGAAI